MAHSRNSQHVPHAKQERTTDSQKTWYSRCKTQLQRICEKEVIALLWVHKEGWQRTGTAATSVARVARLTRNSVLFRGSFLQNFYLAIWLLFGFFATFSLKKFLMERSCEWWCNLLPPPQTEKSIEHKYTLSPQPRLIITDHRGFLWRWCRTTRLQTLCNHSCSLTRNT